jgi:CheY-like chemotaxis protein
MNDGLGIGLALSRQLVQMHEGTIEAISQGRNSGSEFVVKLPLLSQSAQPANLHRTAISAPLSKIKGDHRVLVVDDNTAAAQGVGKLLAYMGYEVDHAYTGAEAIQKADSFHPDSIILDIGLPDMDGYEVATTLRKKIKFSGKLVALTGYGQDEDKEKARAAGFDNHLTKPVGIAELQSVLAIPS